MKGLFSSPAPLASLAIIAATGLLALPSQAGSCSGSAFNSSTCPAGWNTITSGGVTYTISPISFVIAPNPTDSLVFTDAGSTNVNFQYQINPTINTAFTNSFAYTISIATAGYTFGLTQSNATGSDLLGGSYSTTTSNPSNFFSPRTAGSAAGSPSSNATIASGLTSLVVTQRLTNSAGGSTLSSVGANYTAVPGPIPVLGAGMAYGMTRKLRRRIRQAC